MTNEGINETENSSPNENPATEQTTAAQTENAPAEETSAAQTQDTIVSASENPSQAGIAAGDGADAAAMTSGEPTGTDLTLDFLRERPRSMLATIPAMAQRAEVFSAGWMAPWVFLLFGGLTLLAVPACVALALSAAVARDGRGEDGRV